MRSLAVALAMAPLVLAAPIAASVPLAPSAETASEMIITAWIVGKDGIYKLLNPTGILTGVGTMADAVAVSLATKTQVPGETANIHSAFAESSASIGLDFPSDGIIKNSGIIATLYSSHSTGATAAATEPLFSRAVASSQGWVSGINLRNISAAPTVSSLDFTWNFNTLSLSTQPATTFAYMRDTMTLFQQPEGQPGTTSTVGFVVSSENGEAEISLLEGSGTMLSATANSLSFSIPLLSVSGNQNITISFQNSHTELSYEAPPRSVRQVGEKVGYSGAGGAGGAGSSQPYLYWNKDINLLTFDPLPIDILAQWGTDGIEQKYSNDPLKGGLLEIDPLVLFMSLDGRKYFSGNEIRLVDNQQKVLFEATLPTLVFDDSLLDQGFNMFAPILNILQAYTDNAPWLQDYFTRLGAGPAIIPELFMGFDSPLNAGPNLWDSSFNTPVKGVLSFAGILKTTVPAPDTLALFSLGLVGLGLVSLLYRPSHLNRPLHTLASAAWHLQRLSKPRWLISRTAQPSGFLYAALVQYDYPPTR